jgi:membrane protein YqaA with SNARE-associated domain
MDRLTGFFHRLTAAIGPFAERLGAPGLALVAFFDSSVLSLPEVADALLVLAVLHHPILWPYYAAATTVGSVAGCYTLYALARRGGEAFLRRRMRGHHVDRALALFQRFGLLAIVIPSILPPPMPFKVFVLLSGIANVPTVSFLAAVAIGRSFRYGGEAWLAYRYGPQATQYIRENLPTVSVWTAIVVAAVGAAYIFWRRRLDRAKA